MMMHYKGYAAKVEIDLEAGILHGRVQDIRAVINFEAALVDELQRAFAEAVDDYLEDCAEDGVVPERPFSGTMYVRTTPETHRRVADAAKASGQSMNAWIERVLDDAVSCEDTHAVTKARSSAH